jgi:hypothetical protein
MSITLSALEKRVYSRLNEAANTDVAALQSGTSGTPTTTTTQGVIDLYNAVCGELCRTCIPLPGTGTISSYTTGQVVFNLSSLSSLTSGISALWTAYEIAYNGTNLSPAGMLELVNWTESAGGLHSATSATPLYWCEYGDGGNYAINPPPASSYTLKVSGYGVPTVATSGTDTTAWLPDDLLEMLEYRISYLIAAKNFDDETMTGRAQVWNNEFELRRQELISRLPKSLKGWKYRGALNPQK